MDGYEKYERLKQALLKMGRVAVAFSGGADSALLLKTARDVLGDGATAITADGIFFPAWEIDQAARLAREWETEQIVVKIDEKSIPHFKENPKDRCYYCKKKLFEKIWEAARAKGVETVADGFNCDDAFDFRPGNRAAKELNVVSPLADAGLCKAEIRLLSRRLGLETWDKPSCACLASRIPCGMEITREKLAAIAAGEALLRKEGFKQVRLRHHGDIARIEVEEAALALFFEGNRMKRVADALLALGFSYVTLDLKGYRTGSLNKAGGKEELV